MADLEALGALQLSVRDFGPIAEADIELRPLTVFIGPSNTGKSYLATLLHALHHVFRDASSTRGWGPGTGPKLFPDRWIVDGEIRPSNNTLADWLGNAALETTPPTPWKSLRDATVPQAVSEDVHELCKVYFQGSEVLVAALERCFGTGTEMQHLVRRNGQETARVSLRRWYDDASDPFESVRFDFMMGRGGKRTSEATLVCDTPFRTQMRGEGIVPKRSTTDTRRLDTQASQVQFTFNWATEVVYEILLSYTRDLAGPLSYPSYYLPADRSGLLHMNRAVVGLLLRDSLLREREVTVPSLTGIAVDFLAGLIEMGDVAHEQRGEREGVAGALEQKLLKGSVNVKSGGANYPSFSYRPDGWERELSLTNSASMVSELTPVVLFLRHKIRRGDTLVVEEPEASLHPEAQAELVLHLARLMHAGIRVVITTHSDWILEQFANLLRMSGLDNDERKDLPGADAVLTRDQFGAWMFNHDEDVGGTVVKEIEFDPDEGGIASGFGPVAEYLYNTWAEIGNRISDRKLREQS
ncbi:MAG: AAA family ATPase [Chloroflexi bacterium]|nr:AAA family ATPase [Chloroflexota bacterium]